MTIHIKVAVQMLALAALGAGTLLPLARVSHASGARPLVAKDFYSLVCCAGYVSATDPAHPVPTIVDAHFDRGLLLGHSNFTNANATFNMSRYPGYAGFTATVGMIDSSDPNVVETLKITADGKLVYSHDFRQGQTAKSITVPLGKAEAINLEVDSVGDNNATGLLLADPTLLPTAALVPDVTIPPASGGKTAVQLFSATATADGQQTALIATVKNALVAIIIDYPDGTQVTVPSKRAGPDGHFAYTWTIPAGVHGLVHITVDAAGAVAQGTFTVG